MKKDVIIALDFPGQAQAMAFLDQLEELRPYVKVGMELFYGVGPALIQILKDRGHPVFLDLKCHDIPNTVKRTMGVLAGLGVDLCNVHAAGTLKMMEAARTGLEQGTPVGFSRPRLIAVTQLTSTDQWRMNHEIGIPGDLAQVVEMYAGLAKEAGLDGVVCSPEEAPGIHRCCGSDFLAITPGIRPAIVGGPGLVGMDPHAMANAKADQVRVTTPEEAHKLGADFIVVGRPITEAADPRGAYLDICSGFLNVTKLT